MVGGIKVRSIQFEITPAGGERVDEVVQAQGRKTSNVVVAVAEHASDATATDLQGPTDFQIGRFSLAVGNSSSTFISNGNHVYWR